MNIIALGAAFAALSAGAVAAQAPAEAWRIGPVIEGRNYSIGMPPSMKAGPHGPTFAFPSRGEGHVHYVTLRTGPLDGPRLITARYRIDAAPGTNFIAREDGSAGTFGLEFQRAGDNWSAQGKYEAYRWYSPTTILLSPGEHTFTAKFDDPAWVGVLTSRSRSNPQRFASALSNAESVSMTFGGKSGRGHGVFVSSPARFTLLEFWID